MLEGTFTHDKLLGGTNVLPVTEPVTISSGRSLVRGTLLGKVEAGAVPTTGTAGGGNTGATTMTGVVGKSKVKVGTYTITCVAAAAAGGMFQVKSPSGAFLGIAEVGTLFASDEIDFTIDDPGTDAAIGDTFTVVVPAGSGEYVGADKSNIDGSAQAVAVLAEDADATSADKVTVAYVTGQFNKQGIVLVDSGESLATYVEELKARQIHLRDAVAA